MRVGIDLTACWRPRVGMVTAALELTTALLERSVPEGGLEVTIFCSRERPSALRLHRCRAILSPHRGEVVNKLTWLPVVEAQAGLDVAFYPYWPAPPWRRPNAPPAVVFVHDLAFRMRSREVPWQQRVYMGTLVPRAVERAAAIIVPSNVTRQDLLQNYPRPGLADRVHVIPEGLTALDADGAVLPAGLAPGYVLAVGTIERRKNYRRLLQAYRSVRESRPQAPPLVVAGRVGWDCRREVAELLSEPGVRYLGHVPDVTLAALYRGAGVLAFPSLYEGFGLPLLEAMANGLPSLIGSGGSLPELAGGAALEVDAEDPAAIARGLWQLLDDGALRERLADRGRRRAAQFSWASSAAMLMTILEGVL